MRLSCKVFGLICETLWPQKGLTHLPQGPVLLDVVSHVTGSGGHFWPLNWLKHLLWEGSGRRSQAFYMGVLSWIQKCLCHSVYFCFCSQWLLHGDTAHCYHEPLLFTNLWGTIVGSEQVWLPFLWVVLFKSVNLIQRKQNHYLEEISILPCSSNVIQNSQGMERT